MNTGKILQEQDIADNLEFMQQLGLFQGNTFYAALFCSAQKVIDVSLQHYSREAICSSMEPFKPFNSSTRLALFTSRSLTVAGYQP